MRSKADDYDLWVWLCHNRCHIFGKDAVHNNKDADRLVQRWAQKKAMYENKWTVDDFRREFGRNYLEDEDVRELLQMGCEI